jgi:hypothetical protein
MKPAAALAAVAMAVTLVGTATGSVAVPGGAEMELAGYQTFHWPWQPAHHVPDGPQTFEIEGKSVAGLYPGAARSMAIRVRNPYKFDLKITRLNADVVKSNRRACPARPANLVAGKPSGQFPITVRARQSREAGSIPIRMPSTVTNECAGVTFTIRITGVATKVQQ